jgi:hypothetical protein
MPIEYKLNQINVAALDHHVGPKVAPVLTAALDALLNIMVADPSGGKRTI